MAGNDPLIGKELGDYLLQSLIGRGGMARVYLGYDKNLDRYAAIKVIETHLITGSDSAEYYERFQREARSIAKLNHPNIVGIYQFGQYGRNYYMAMEFIDGRDLRLVLKDYNRKGEMIPVTRMLRVLRHMASALDYAHEKGVIHRDIKPSNILVTKEDDKAVLTDFGLALNVPEGTVGNTFGSAHYIAPEQAVSSAQAVPQSDLYSLGIVLYEMMTGRVPFDDASAMSVALKHLSDPPPPPSQLNPAISSHVEAVILKSLEKEPHERYQTGQLFIRALEHAFAMSGYVDTTISSSMGGITPPVAPPQRKSSNPFIDSGYHLEQSPTPPPMPAAQLPQPVTPPLQLSDADRTGVKPPTARTSTANVVIESPIAADPSKRPIVTKPAEAGASTNLPKRSSEETIEDRLSKLKASNVNRVTSKKNTSPSPSNVATPISRKEREQRNRMIAMIISGVVVLVVLLLVIFAVVSGAGEGEPTPSDGATLTLPTSAPTLTDIPPTDVAPTADPMAGLVLPAVATPAPNMVAVTLIYDQRTLILLNASGQTVDISNLLFQSGNASFRSNRWANGTRPVTALPSGDCFQIWLSDAGTLPQPDYCIARHRWLAVTSENAFWNGSTGDAVFFVQRNDDLVGTCVSTAETSRCEFSVPISAG